MQNWILFFVVLFHEHLIIAQISNPRHPAEWEEVSAILMEADLLLAFPTLWEEAIDPFVKVAQVCIEENIHLYVIDPDTGGNYSTRFVEMDTVFSNRGLVSPYIHIIHVNTPIDNFPWARDNGPYTIYEDKINDRYFAGYSDDIVADFISNVLGENYIDLPKVSTDILYYDGGNWLTDGHNTFNICNTSGSGFANGLIKPPILPFGEYLGSEKTLNVTGVDVHTDYWIKLLNEETIVTGYLPPENYINDPSGYRPSQAYVDTGIAAIKAHLKSSFSRDFKFFQIQNAPSFDDATINTTYLTEWSSYTNSLIINKTVLVPQFTYLPYDTIAISIYKQMMPGYKVVGVNCRQYAVGGGALHCITREIYADNPIYIKHAWLPDSLNQTTDYSIDAVIASQGGINSAKLFWSIDLSSGFNEIEMTALGNDIFRGIIPGQSYETNICYYISVENNNGKIISKPPVAPEGYFKTIIHPGGVNIVPETDNKNLLENFSLAQNYPNPFNPSTTIEFSMANAGLVQLSVFNILGEEVKTLVNEERYAGNHSVQFNAGNLASGIYFYKLQAGNFVETKKMVLLK